MFRKVVRRTIGYRRFEGLEAAAATQLEAGEGGHKSDETTPCTPKKNCCRARLRYGQARTADGSTTPGCATMHPTAVCRAPLAIGTDSRPGSGLRNGVSDPWAISRGPSHRFLGFFT